MFMVYLICFGAIKTLFTEKGLINTLEELRLWSGERARSACHESVIVSCPSPSRQMTAVCHLNTFLDMRRIMATFVGEFVTVMQPREMSIRKSRVK